LGYFSLWLLGATLCCLPRRLPVPAWLPPLLLASLLTLVRLRLLDGWSVFQQDLVIAALLGLWLNQLEHQVAAAPGPAAWHRRLAGFSYSLYLVHWPLALLLSVVLDKFTGHGHRMAFSAGAVLLYGAVLAFIYAFAWLVAQGTERHTASIRGKCLPSPCAGLPLPLPPAA
ncbi:MAG TPA: hypothetical protein VKC51_04970, partial [Lacunisphaera sp.]|nr:hypothetical protein [Lacunisphaera sp.]